MAPGQDWCLECGTAAPGRLGRRPGLRAAATVVGADAGCSSPARSPPATPRSTATPAAGTAKPPVASGAPVAQAPPAHAARARRRRRPPRPRHAAAQRRSRRSTAPRRRPPVSHPTTPAPPAPVDAGADHAHADDHDTPTDDDAVEARHAGDPADRPRRRRGMRCTTRTRARPPAATRPTPTTATPRPPGRSRPAADGQEMQVGLVVDLGKKRSVKELRLHDEHAGLPHRDLRRRHRASCRPTSSTRAGRTSTAQTSVDEGRAPSRWRPDSHRYRYVLLWFTTPPKKGPTVKINELTILG